MISRINHECNIRTMACIGQSVICTSYCFDLNFVKYVSSYDLQVTKTVINCVLFETIYTLENF